MRTVIYVDDEGYGALWVPARALEVLGIEDGDTLEIDINAFNQITIEKVEGE
jgi:bifunctional DNA-binding transcriptional regulator/antitoxin component of YhaV-PrlF toxin-antitoxin module